MIFSRDEWMRLCAKYHDEGMTMPEVAHWRQLKEWIQAGKPDMTQQRVVEFRKRSRAEETRAIADLLDRWDKDRGGGKSS